MTIQRVWMITGASRGLGISIAAAALANGDAVAATARSPESIIDRLGSQPNLLALKLDVTQASDAVDAVTTALDRFGRIDVLVNNAGFGMTGAIEEASDEEIRRLYETNVFGLLNVTRQVLPHFRKQRAGHLINISSLGGYRSGAGFGIYCSTKFAVEALSEALRSELAPLGVRVTVVEPGSFRTDFLDDSSLAESKMRIADYDETAGATRSRAKKNSRQQAGDPQKLGQALLTLVSAAHPPCRLQLGTDALAAVKSKNAFVQKEMDVWQELSASTGFLPAGRV